MPETYNFTVRATDALGAYADRAFSITVSNTQVDRLLAVGQSGAARALNGNNPWVLIPGVKGDSAAYGDRWLIWDQVAGVMWRSADAINWTPITPTLPGGYTSLGFLRWRAGAWWAVGGTGSALAVLTSTNGGATWAVAGATIAAAAAYSFERSEAGASIIATNTEWHFRPDNSSAWSVVKTFAATSYRFQIAHLNGIWFGPNDTLPNGLLARSTDGQGWFAQSNPTVLTGGGFYRGTAWGNGYALACAYFETIAGFTTDAGLTVQAGATLPAPTLLYDTECPIVCVQGRFVMLGDAGRTFAANTPAGPWAASNLPFGLTPSTLAVRP